MIKSKTHEVLGDVGKIYALKAGADEQITLDEIYDQDSDGLECEFPECQRQLIGRPVEGPGEARTAPNLLAAWADREGEVLKVSVEGRSDAELIELVSIRGRRDRVGSLERAVPTGTTDPALGYARNLAGESIAADLVSECLEKTLVLLRRGQGPEGALRPYLFTAIRHAHVDHLRRSSREVPRDDMAELATTGGEAESDGADARFEATTIMRAFASLPERWRTVLWHTAVASQPLDRVAKDLGMNANSVAALSFRAREGLRRAYLAEHLTRTPDPECRAVLGALVPYLRGGLRPRQADLVALHFDVARPAPRPWQTSRTSTPTSAHCSHRSCWREAASRTACSTRRGSQPAIPAPPETTQRQCGLALDLRWHSRSGLRPGWCSSEASTGRKTRAR